MARNKMHNGPLFREFILEVIKSKSARSYVEVGVRDGSTLTLIDCPSIGIDPDFQFSMNPMGKKKALHLFQMTSDEFFRQHDPRHILKVPIDVVFLDGLHRIEYLLRDFINSENICHRDSVILLDDCLPVNAEMTERRHRPALREDQELAGWWTGDVWKMLPILLKYRPDLRVTPVDVAPTGSICVTNLDPNSKVLSDNYFHIVTEHVGSCMSAREFELFYDQLVIESASELIETGDLSIFVGP